MIKGAIFSLILILLAVPFVSGQITFSQMPSLYNLGDSLSVEPTLLEDSSVSAMVKIMVECGSSNFLFFTSPVDIAAGKEHKLIIPNLKLSEDQGILGSCNIKLTLEDSAKRVIDEKSSENFKISNNVSITINTNREEYTPGKKVTVSGMAVKENGQNVNGNASVNLDITMVTDVKAGFFMTDITLDNNAVSGEHEIVVNVEDADHNRGTATKKIIVTAIPSRLELQINNDIFMPQDKLEASIKLFDQANNEIDTKGTITVYDPEFMEMTSRQVNTNEKLEFSFPKTAKPGKWEIIGFSSGKNLKKFVDIQKVSNISMALENSSIIVTNEGNVDYSDTISFSFEKEGQTQTLTKDVNIEVGKSLRIPLSGEGVYNLKVESKSSSLNLPAIPLTGGVIGVGAKVPINYIAVAVFIIGIFALGFVSLRRRRKESPQIDVKKVNIKQSDIEKAEQE